MLRLEVTDLEFKDKIAMQTGMVEGQIDAKDSIVPVSGTWLPRKGESAAQLQEKHPQTEEQMVRHRAAMAYGNADGTITDCNSALIRGRAFARWIELCN